eukprot:SM000071S21070  [mRNA]  locus=s71:198264:200543:+ [translate_table: standard]
MAAAPPPAFREFDFDSSAAWLEYARNLTIPPAADQAAALRRVRQKWFQRNVVSPPPSPLPSPRVPADRLCASTPDLRLHLGIRKASSQHVLRTKHVDPLLSDRPRSCQLLHLPPLASQDPSFHVDAPLPSTPAAGPGPRSTSGTGANAGPNVYRRPSTSRPAGEATTSGGASPAGGAAEAGRGPTGSMLSFWQKHSKTVLFLANAWVLVMAVVHILPFTPRRLSQRAFRFSLLGSIVAALTSLYIQHGLPAALQLEALRAWLQRASSSGDLIQLLHSIIFLSSPMPLQPLLQAASHLRTNFSATQIYRTYLAGPCMWLQHNANQVQQFAASTALGLGFLLIFLLFTPNRNFLQVVLYWQLLRLQYHAPSTAARQRQAWQVVGQQVEPLLHRFIPAVLPLLARAKAWFTTPR